METFSFLVTGDMCGRIDKALSLGLNHISRSYGQRLIEQGLVRLDGQIVSSKKLEVEFGQRIEVAVPQPEVLNIEAENIPIDIVYEDDELLVVNKPKGMVVHPAPGNYSKTLVNAIMYHCSGRLSSINGVIRPGIVHRIDKDTSGLLVVAKTDFAHEGLAEQFKEHSIERVYYALVRDNIKEDEGTIHEPIGRDPKDRLRNWVTYENSKDAVTHFSVLERFKSCTLVSCRLETGRTHQIRVHMAYIKHPLLGDPLYGASNDKYKELGQFLHAKTLGFIHPRTQKFMEFTSELPVYMNDFMVKLRESK